MRSWLRRGLTKSSCPLRIPRRLIAGVRSYSPSLECSPLSGVLLVDLALWLDSSITMIPGSYRRGGVLEPGENNFSIVKTEAMNY